MDAATRARRVTEPVPPVEAGREHPLLVAVAGPTLIVVVVLVVLRGIAFLPRLPDQHPDVLSFWLPRSCLLGRALSDGRVPLWNPFEMAGTPFAADPQSGWLSAPTMLLSGTLGCGGGLRALIVLNPILAGLGLFWFCRRERLGRLAATAGGLSISMAIATSTLAISLPFAGTLAWTTILLVGASGYLAGRGWRRLGWLALAALAWGQVASSHLSHGLLMATGVVLAYVIARSIHDARRADVAPRTAVLIAVGFLAFLPLANVAIWFPRLDAIAASSLADGYTALEGTVTRAAEQDLPVATSGIWAGWPFALASTPGAYVGSVVLLCIPFAFRDTARRSLVVALSVVAIVAYLLTSTVMVGTAWFRSLVLTLPFGDVYLHNPGRLRFLAFLIVPTLGAIGIQWLLTTRPPFARALPWFGVGLLVLLGLPLAIGAIPLRLLVFALGAVALLVVVRAISRGRRWAPFALCGILVVELLGAGLWSSGYRGGTVTFGLESGRGVLAAGPLRWPEVDLRRYLEAGPIARAIRSDRGHARYLAWLLPDASFNKGYLFTRAAPDWPALLLGRAVVFEIPDVLGYSPVQLPRYWAYVRATNDLPVFYNASVIQVPTARDLQLLGARYLIASDGQPLPPGIDGEIVAEEGSYRLVRIDGSHPRVSVVPDWRIVTNAARAVLDPGFDPSTSAVLEQHPEIEPVAGGEPGSATYGEIRPESIRIVAEASVPSIVVIRNAWAEGWSARVDGRPAPILRTDLFLQGVAVPAGTHDVRLTYHAPELARGLVGSAIVWVGFVAFLVVAIRRRRRSADRADA